MQFEKRAVRLGDIRPSSQNPREDFGDIAAAAEEAYCVDFGACDEIARIAEDLGVDADF